MSSLEAANYIYIYMLLDVPYFSPTSGYMVILLYIVNTYVLFCIFSEKNFI